MKLALSGGLILLAAFVSVNASARRGNDDGAVYTRDIAPVFRQKCVPCHTEQGVGPFPLETYKQVKARGALIRYVLMQRKMPPLAADSDMGKLRTIHRITDMELVAFQEWVRTNYPLGGVEPALPVKAFEWRMGKPDMVITGGVEATVNAEGAPYSREIRVPLSLDRARRIRAIDFKPKVGRVWRRAIVARAYPLEEKKSVFDPLGLPASRLIGSWGLGALPWKASEGAGVEINPGEDLAVIPLWQPSGKKESGEFEIALYFDDEAKVSPQWQTLGKADFVIPPQDGFTDLHATTTLSADIDVLSILPEARLYARLVRLTAKPPDGEEQVLFMVRNWDSEWAGSYNFERPVRLPKGTRLDLTMTYDNSGHALGEIRENPPALKFGPTLKDELFWLHFQFVTVSGEH